jgi:hypothetical protein
MTHLFRPRLGSILLVAAMIASVHACDADDPPPSATEAAPLDSLAVTDRVARVVDHARSAQERLQAGQVDDETTALQRQIVADLDELLADIDQHGRQPSTGTQPARDTGFPSSAIAPETSGAAQQGTPGADPGEGSAPDPGAPSLESAERSAPAESPEVARERRLGLATAAWGHLPPKERERMRSAFSETYLPQYDDLLRRYYQALASRRRAHTPSESPVVP